MTKITFGKTGLMISPLAFGGGPIGYLGVEQKRIDTILRSFLDEGLNLIDTAACYPGSEQAIGNAVADRRDEYILVSKCGHRVDGVTGDEWSPEIIEQTVDRALENLRTGYLDVMLLHSCDLEVLQRGEALGALLRARDAGKVRFVGYSGDNEAAAYAAGLPDVAVLETSINICDQANIETALPRARENDLGVIAKRPLANAAWRSKSEQSGIYAEYASTYAERLSRMKLAPADLGFEGDPAGMWPEIALRFTLSQEGVGCAIIGTTSVDHLHANLSAAARGPLPQTVVAVIREAFQRAEAEGGEKWEAQI